MKDGWYKDRNNEMILVKENTIIEIRNDFDSVGRDVNKIVTPEMKKDLKMLEFGSR